MHAGFRIGEFEITWLDGGAFELDGGAMFGVVPKVLWEKKYPVVAENYISLRAWPILVRTPQALVLIESGLGNKLTDKQKNIFRVRQEWNVLQDLRELGIDRNDITHVILTHYDFDHAGGVVMRGGSGQLELTFPRAKHILQRAEWDDVLHPNIRNINTFWPVNNEVMRASDALELIDGDGEVVPGIRVMHTAGHNRGHQVVTIESGGDMAMHLADLLPTHAHGNPLWVMAYDNYPMVAIQQKEQWIKRGVEKRAWFTFYHDVFMLACRFGPEGKVVETWGAAKALGST